MQTKKSPEELLEYVASLLEKYSNEQRATTQPYHLARVQRIVTGYEYHPEDELVRENLIEHIGSLPVVATALYPHINDSQVNLGDALTMLAIHDIGELVVHDEMVFTRKKENKTGEREAALDLLHPSYHALYHDVETQKSQSAKFAKAIDKITPDILDYLTPPEVTIWRFRHFVGVEPEEIINLIVKFKRPYMLWNPFMTEFHKVLLAGLADKLGQKRENP